MKKLDIIYEDKELIAINKPSGLYTISPDNKFSKNLYSEVREYIKKQNPKNKIFIVHRLDKDTSGIIIFAKNERLKRALQNNWNSICESREYLAIVEGVPKKKKDRLVNFLAKTKTMQVYITDNKKIGKVAITNYEVINTNPKYSLLKINIETGRKNQIRVQLSNLGNPIVGDKKYGAKTNPINRLGLHASKLVITNPINHKEMEFVAKTPKAFDFK